MFFYLRAQTTVGQRRDCGNVSIYTKNTPLPKIQQPDSIKKWQSTNFYIHNISNVDQIGLPAFSGSLPAHKSWSRKPLIDEALEGVLFGRLKELVDAGLTSRDLTLAWLSRRIFPAACAVAQDVLLLRSPGSHPGQHGGVEAGQPARVGCPPFHRQN